MVTKSRFFALIFVLLFTLGLYVSPRFCMAQVVAYNIDKEWVQITINKDRSIYILYNITITYIGGSPQGIVTVGMPQGGFQIISVQDISGDSLNYEDVSYDDNYAIDVTLKSPVYLYQPKTFTVYALVPEMLYKDETNTRYWGMQFYPTNFPDASGLIDSVRVAIVLPSGVTSDEVRYMMGTPFDSVYTDNDNNLVVYWERDSWQAWQEFTVGVSFPERYITLPGPDIVTYVAIGAAVVAAFGFIIIIVPRFRKLAYERPRIAIEALGAARNLTSVEAAVVLGSKPVRVLTMVLFGLIYKRIVMVTETDPLIKIQRLKSTVESPPDLRYYEIEYLEALQPDGNLDEMKLARTFLDLRDNVDQKMRGYSRNDTVNYYKSVVNKAWDQVTQAGTPELKGDALDQNIEWLLADDGFDDKFKNAFPPNIVIVPSPGWWWYWHGPYSPSGPVAVPAKTPSQPTPIPGQDFANNVVRGLEASSNNMVKNVQAFTNRIVQAPAPVSQSSVRSRPSCVCACAHCACACACVSCACACAHGGAR
jgi:hypothetical protein